MAKSFRLKGAADADRQLCNGLRSQRHTRSSLAGFRCKTSMHIDHGLPLTSLKLPANIIVLFSSFLSTLASVIAVAFTTIINHRAPETDTLKTWTCRWSERAVDIGHQQPDQFHSLCRETVGLRTINAAGYC